MGLVSLFIKSEVDGEDRFLNKLFNKLLDLVMDSEEINILTKIEILFSLVTKKYDFWEFRESSLLDFRDLEFYFGEVYPPFKKLKNFVGDENYVKILDVIIHNEKIIIKNDNFYEKFGKILNKIFSLDPNEDDFIKVYDILISPEDKYLYWVFRKKPEKLKMLKSECFEFYLWRDYCNLEEWFGCFFSNIYEEIMFLEITLSEKWFPDEKSTLEMMLHNRIGKVSPPIPNYKNLFEEKINGDVVFLSKVEGDKYLSFVVKNILLRNEKERVRKLFS